MDAVVIFFQRVIGRAFHFHRVLRALTPPELLR
jgi:hypothetical protein